MLNVGICRQAVDHGESPATIEKLNRLLKYLDKDDVLGLKRYAHSEALLNCVTVFLHTKTRR
jgi:hypothetical protein